MGRGVVHGLLAGAEGGMIYIDGASYQDPRSLKHQ